MDETNGNYEWFKKAFRIKTKDFIHAGGASINVQNLLKSMDFDPQIIRQITICGYECEMNVVMHGGDGQLSVDGLEVSYRIKLAKAAQTISGVGNFSCVTASDAHFLNDIGKACTVFELAEPSLAEIRLALAGKDGRRILV